MGCKTANDNTGMREETKYLIQEYKEMKEWKERWEANHIEMDNYFKYSGQVEPTKVLISRYKYNSNSNCNDLHEKYINKKAYEKICENKASKNYPGRFSKEIEAFCWDETDDGVWSD